MKRFLSYLRSDTFFGDFFGLRNVFFNRKTDNAIFSKEVSLQSIQGKGIQVLPGSFIDGTSCIGSYTYIGYHCHISRTDIGRYCSIANNASIGMGEHLLDRISTSSLFYKESYEQLTAKACSIGHDVWIGVDSIVRRGVRIGNGAVIGANSVVTRDVPDFAVVVGSPAKIIKYRFTQEQIERIVASKWWELDLDEAREVIEGLQKEAGLNI